MRASHLLIYGEPLLIIPSDVGVDPRLKQASKLPVLSCVVGTRGNTSVDPLSKRDRNAVMKINDP